ncbi:hypothetical protein V3C99_013643 [Haemonchus contortus]
MKICSLCGVRGEEHSFVRAQSRTSLIILLSVLLEQCSVELARARTVLKECPARRKRICAEHYGRAVAFLDRRAARLKNVLIVLQDHWLALDRGGQPKLTGRASSGRRIR